MKYIYILRHAAFDPSSGMLTQQGVDQARLFIEDLNNIKLVFTAPIPVSIQTAQFLTKSHLHTDVRAIDDLKGLCSAIFQLLKDGDNGLIITASSVMLRFLDSFPDTSPVHSFGNLKGFIVDDQFNLMEKLPYQ